jgi:hypothetical protein
LEDLEASLREAVVKIEKYCREHAMEIVKKHPREDYEYWFKRCKKSRVALMIVWLLSSKRTATVPSWLIDELA